MICVPDVGLAGARGNLCGFRGEFYRCLSRRPDALFELTDAMLCLDGPVRSLVELSLAGEHRRGHGSLYAALAKGRCDAARLRRALASALLPRAGDGRLVLSVDITCWLRPEAHTSAQRILCHTHGRDKDRHLMIPGSPYSVICALEPGRSSWTAPLDARRLAPGDDAAEVTAAQVRQVVAGLITAGQWRPGDLDILIVADAGHDTPRLAYLLAGLPVAVLGRMRSDRVLRRPAPPRRGVFGDPATRGAPQLTTTILTRLYGVSDRPVLGPAAPAADPPFGLGGGTLTAAGDRPAPPWEQPAPADSLRPGPERISTPARKPDAQPARQNPPGPAADGPLSAPTPAQPPATTCTPPSKTRPRKPRQAHPAHATQVKDQARGSSLTSPLSLAR